MEVLNVSRASSDERLFSCPFPGHSSGDSKPSAYMNDGSKDKSKATVWKCHGCGRAGNAITFYSEMEDVSKQEAADHLREQYAPNFRAPKGGSISAEFEMRLRDREEELRTLEREMPTIEWSRYEKLFGVDWYDAEQQAEDPDCPPEVAYMFTRGFTADTLTHWQIGYDARSERITIPVCNEVGELVGVKGRSWKSKKLERIKYMILGDKEGRRSRYGWRHYDKSLVLFGLDKVIGKTDVIVLVEGELDVIALWQAGIPAVSTGSAHLSVEQARLLRMYFDEVIVFFDIDEEDEEGDAGYDATWGYHDKDGDFHPGVVQILQPFMRVKIVPNHEDDASKMVEQSRVTELEELVASAVSSYRLMLE